MSYGGGYNQPPYGAPPQNHSPYPQQNQYHPPTGQSPYPPQQPPPMNYQQQYPPHGPPPSQYGGGYPPQGPPPPQGPYGAQPYGAPPPQHGYPQQPYPPQQGYPPPPQQHQQPYGAPAQAPYGAPAPAMYTAPTPPSLGYDPHQSANVDTSRDADALRAAMKGIGTNEASLCSVLGGIPDPLIMANVRRTFAQRHRRDLLKDISSETSSYFGETCEAIVRGPLEQDVHLLRHALKGAGTKESELNDVLLGRSNADMRAIKAEYQRLYRTSLEADVRGDLSLKTETLFAMVLAANRAEESAPVLPQQTDADANELHRATIGVKFGADQLAVCSIFASRSDGQLRAISHAYQQKYREQLSNVIRKEFSGHMEAALLRMLLVAEDRAMADAQSLEDAMAGMGTKDRLLLNRLVRIHWNRDHRNQVKGAYKHRFKRDLVSRVKGETSRDFERILVAIIG